MPERGQAELRVGEAGESKWARKVEEVRPEALSAPRIRLRETPPLLPGGPFKSHIVGVA